MNYKIAWSGLADERYWDLIARFCVPSWINLPGDKFIIHDSNKINIPEINVINWSTVNNVSSKFLKLTDKSKPLSFWRKMQSQLWAVKNLKKYDFVILLDTDVEVINWNKDKFEDILNQMIESNSIWAVGESQRNGIDSGHIIINMKHPDVEKLFTEYENFWETGEILKLRKWYDGHVIENLIERYPFVKIKNRDYGSGLHVYQIGTVHWGSKEPKILRANWKNNGKSLVEKRLSEITIKHYKNDAID